MIICVAHMPVQNDVIYQRTRWRIPMKKSYPISVRKSNRPLNNTLRNLMALLLWLLLLLVMVYVSFKHRGFAHRWWRWRSVCVCDQQGMRFKFAPPLFPFASISQTFISQSALLPFDQNVNIKTVHLIWRTHKHTHWWWCVTWKSLSMLSTRQKLNQIVRTCLCVTCPKKEQNKVLCDQWYAIMMSIR